MPKPTAQTVPRTGEFRQHGFLIAPCLAGIMLAAVHSYSLGVLIHPLEQEFGWSRAAITTGNMIIALFSLGLSPLVGMAIDRYGPRRVAVLGVFAYSILLANISSSGSDVHGWWLRWAMLGLASATILPMVWTTAINRAFDQNRGKALAFVMIGTGLSAAIVPMLTSILLDHFGWRGAYLGLGGGIGAIALLLVLTLFRGPATVPVALLVRSGVGLAGLSVGEGLRSAQFRKLALAVFIFALTCLALTVNAVPVLEARGLSRPVAAGAAGLLGIGSILGRLGGGFLLDRFAARSIAALAVLVPVASVALLLLPGPQWQAGAAMLLLGLALGTEVDACAFLVSRYLGMRNYGVLFGTITGFTVFGSSLAPVVANYVYDRMGSYDLVLWASMPLCALSALLFHSLGPYPDFGLAEAPGDGLTGRPA